MFTEFIGVIQRTHGLDGTVVLCDTVFQSLHLTEGGTVGVGFSKDHLRPMMITTITIAPSRTTVRFTGIHTPEQASQLIDCAVYVQTSALPIEAAERFAIGDIVGCVVYSDEGMIGTVTDVWLLPAHDVWEITTAQGTTIPVPVVDHYIREVDVVKKTIVVSSVDGLDTLYNTSSSNSERS
jgi:16S rRNA processing protein RimM